MDYPYEVVSSDAEHSTVAIKCPSCGNTSLLKVRNAGLLAREAGAMIQVAFPDLSAADREMFVSGICDGCFHEFDDFDCEYADECDEDDCEDCDGCDCCDGCADPAGELGQDEIAGD